MNTIYTKYTDYRRPRFRIMTSIREEGRRKSVIKRTAPGGHAQAHLDGLKHNGEILQKLYGNTLKVCPCRYEGKNVIFPFVEGTTYLEHLRRTAQTEGRDGFLRLLRTYVEILEGPQDNHVPFRETEGFRDVFGSFPGLDGLPALMVSNLDASPDNLIEDAEGAWNLIDYEWVFSFPIPRDFIVFRHLHFLYAERGFPLFARLPFEELLAAFDVKMDMSHLFALHDAFQRYVCVGKGSDLREEEIFLRHLQPIRDVREGIAGHNTHFVFLDTGNGFNEQEKLLFAAKDGPLRLPVGTEGVFNLRFDPFEGQQTLTENLRFVTDSGRTLDFQAPDFLKSRSRMLLNCPANVVVAVPPGTGEIIIDGSCQLAQEKDAEWFARTADLEKREDTLKTQLEETTDALESIREICETEKARADLAYRNAMQEKDARLATALAQVKALENVLEVTTNSRSWKMTGWLRRLKRLRQK